MRICKVCLAGAFWIEQPGFLLRLLLPVHSSLSYGMLPSKGELVGASGGTGTSATVAFDTPGTFYYICDIGSHCESGGMKLIIEVRKALVDTLDVSMTLLLSSRNGVAH